MTSFVAPFLGIDKPLTITQILWINLVMDTLAALAFGGEPALASYMQEQPKQRGAAIVSTNMLRTIRYTPKAEKECLRTYSISPRITSRLTRKDTTQPTASTAISLPVALTPASYSASRTA